MGEEKGNEVAQQHVCHKERSFQTWLIFMTCTLNIMDFGLFINVVQCATLYVTICCAITEEQETLSLSFFNNCSTNSVSYVTLAFGTHCVKSVHRSKV